MATAKKAVKKSGQQAGGKEVVSWADALALRATIARSQAASTGGGSKGIGTAGGEFSIDGSPAGTVLNVIMLDSVLEHAFYGEKYDPDNRKPPVCFAFGRNEKEMAPHEDSPEPQCETCASCEWNKFGSADTGKGKACKNIVRMMVISEDDLEDVEASEPRMLKVPVTSVKNWKGYTQGIVDVKNSDPIAVLTEVALHRHPKFQFEMKFRNLGDVDNEVVGLLIDKSDANQSALVQPYSPKEEEEEKPRGKGAAKAMGKAPAKPAPKPAAGARGAGRR